MRRPANRSKIEQRSVGRRSARSSRAEPNSAEVAKRVDTYATALYHAAAVDSLNELDLSYTPPLGSRWRAIQVADQTWVHKHRTTTAQPLVA